MPLLPCPHCDQNVSVAISQAGSEVTCPGCQKLIRVPKLGELKRIDAEMASGAEAVSPPNTPATDQTGRRVMFGGLLAIAGIAGIVGLFCVVRYLSVEVPATTEIHIAEIDRLYHESPAAQLVREWELMEKSNLDVTGPYGYKKLEIEKSRWARNSMLAGGVFAVAALSAVIVGLGERRRRSA